MKPKVGKMAFKIGEGHEGEGYIWFVTIGIDIYLPFVIRKII